MTSQNTQNERSQFYSNKPIFASVPTPPKQSRLEGNRFLLIFTVSVIVVAVLTGLLYVRRQPTTPVIRTQAVPLVR